MQTASDTSIRRGLDALRARWTRVTLVQTGVRAAFYLTLLGALLLVLFPAWPRATVVLALAGFGLVATLVAALVARPSDERLAKDFDDATGGADRVTSAVLLREGSTGMVAALHQDAARATEDLRPESVYPLRLPREGRWLPVPALLALAALLVPGFFATPAAGDPAFEQSAADRLAQLEELLSREQRREPTRVRKDLLEELERLRAELDGQKPDRKDTMAEVAKLLDELQSEREAEAKRREELKKLVQGMQDQAGKSSLAQMMDEARFEDALHKLQEDIEDLEKQLEELKKKGATPEELAELEEQLKKLKEIEAKLKQLLQVDLDLSLMGEAIDFLADWDGELGDLADIKAAKMLEPGEPCPLCAKGEP